jgi:hypothetical protein
MKAASKHSRHGHRDATMILIGFRHGLRAAHTRDETPSRRERSEPVDGRRNPGDGKRSGGRGEDSLQDRDRHNGDRIYDFVVPERAIMIRDGSVSVRRVRHWTRSLSRSVISRRLPEQDRDAFPAIELTAGRRSDGVF